MSQSSLPDLRAASPDAQQNQPGSPGESLGDYLLDDTPDEPQERSRTRVSFSIRRKIVLFLVVLLVVLTAAAALFATNTLRGELTREFTSKGEAIAASLTTNAVDYIVARDPSTVQTLVDQFAELAGVAYILVVNDAGVPIAHTFAPFIPAEVRVPTERPADLGEAAFTRTLDYTDAATGENRTAIEIETPLLGGLLGDVRVGMDQGLITAQVTQSALALTGILAAAGLLAVLAGVVFAGRLSEPVQELVGVSERVGRGDLSTLADVRSNDEIGLLGETFNDAIVKLRGSVQTERERDEERRRRAELQANITNFLDIITDVAQGDLTQRGMVTADVLGNVVDATNFMVEEINYLLLEVREVAQSVNDRAQGMIETTDTIVSGTQQQTQEAQRVSDEVVQVTESMSQMASTATASAQAAQRTRDISNQGQEAVSNTLEGMQGIRREVQTVAKRMKTLGDRSLEISEIVETISRIASQTNLLSLNAAIEAAGAGEAGGRFAIVADEVRRLADDSAQATQRIANLIKSVQAEVQEVIAVVENSTREVESGYRVATEAGARLRDIATIAEESAQFAQTISESTQLQVGRINEVGGSVQSIAELSSRSDTLAQQGRSSAEELRQLSAQLTENLGRFKLAIES
ncbi:MAG: methyl-accepting chemotaxis protein [Trueperaceae bacterium]|nr:methyl-accepting chemotaxis protein [Trueperaceae bacterium]